MTITVQDVEKNKEMMHDALRARDRLAQLSKSESFRQKYFSGDPDAVAAYDELVARHAAGYSLARDVKFGTPTTVNTADWEARNEAVGKLTHDPDFVKRYLAGDQTAVQQWREASTDNTKAVLGISEEAPIDAGLTTEGVSQ